MRWKQSSKVLKSPVGYKTLKTDQNKSVKINPYICIKLNLHFNIYNVYLYNVYKSVAIINHVDPVKYKLCC